MTDLRKATEIASEALDTLLAENNMANREYAAKANQKLRQALAQPEQDPVAHLWECIGRWTAMIAHDGEDANLAPPDWLVDAVKAATAPLKREWVGLEDEDVATVKNEFNRGALWAEAKLKEKNT